MATYVFNTLKTKYKGFHHPVVVIEVNDMVIGEGKAEIPVSDISVEDVYKRQALRPTPTGWYLSPMTQRCGRGCI